MTNVVSTDPPNSKSTIRSCLLPLGVGAVGVLALFFLLMRLDWFELVVNTPVSNAPIVVVRRHPITLSARTYELEQSVTDPKRPEGGELRIDVSFVPAAGAQSLFVNSAKALEGAAAITATDEERTFKDVDGVNRKLTVSASTKLLVKYVASDRFQLTLDQDGVKTNFDLQAVRGDSLSGKALPLKTRELADLPNYRATEVTVDMLQRKAVFYLLHH